MRVTTALIILPLVCFATSACLAQKGTQSPLVSRLGQMTMNTKTYTVSQDSIGRVITRFDLGRKNQLIAMGTPYWDYPTWQEGSVRLNDQLKEIPCEVAYNVITNDVLCRFNDDPKVYPLNPLSFTIKDAQFICHPILGNTYPIYYRVLYQGDSQLLQSFKRRIKSLKDMPYNEAYTYMIGYYLGLEQYYWLRLPGQPLKPVKLTRKSLLGAMGNSINKKLLPAGPELTVNDVITILANYDAH